MEKEKILIDANRLKRRLARFEEFMVEFGNVEAAKATKAIINGLKIMPTEDAVEVVHGRWIHVPSSDMMTGKAYKCSECNKMRYGSFMPNYCQNCGAKMDGDGSA